MKKTRKQKKKDKATSEWLRLAERHGEEEAAAAFIRQGMRDVQSQWSKKQEQNRRVVQCVDEPGLKRYFFLGDGFVPMD